MDGIALNEPRISAAVCCHVSLNLHRLTALYHFTVVIAVCSLYRGPCDL